MSVVASELVDREGPSRSMRNFWVGAVIAFCAAALLFTALPRADLIASHLFYASDGGFLGNRLQGMRGLRTGFLWLYWAAAAVSLWGLLATALGKPGWLRLAPVQWLYVLICLAVGPGLVANVALKDHWGRARPREVAEFGGHRAFTPALKPTNQCAHNCSFVSGEASSAFIPFYAMALVVPQQRALLLAVGTIAGLSIGVVRMAQGAHFLSDIVFAGVFMALTAGLVHHLMLAWPWAWAGLHAGSRPRREAE
jgi:lipid A 4'-phosphatase